MINDRLTHKRLTTALAWLVTLCLLSSIHLSFAADKVDAAKKDISGIQKQINKIKKELSKTKQQQHDVTDALKESETAISQANKTLHKIDRDQKQNKSKLSKLKEQSLTISEKLSRQQKELSKLLYQRYALGNQSYTRLILQSKNPSQISRDLKYQSYIAKAHTKLINDMQSNLSEIKQLDTKTTQVLQKAAKLKEKHEDERKNLQKQKFEKALVLKKISKEIAAQHGQISKLKRDEKRLSRLVVKLSISAKNESQKKPKNKTASKAIPINQQSPDNRYAGKKFSSLKGKLKLPVKGEVTNLFGRKRQDGGISWKGLFIRAKEGASVKSVAGGQVVFAEWMRGFGNLIIVDHGSGYMSLYGNNQTILKNVGEDVNGGDVIAAVGNTGGNKSNGLYYELRKKSVPFDPLQWSLLR
ncbi:MAG: peptidoglycan DD-metalloendopeptidase family protein [Methylophilaceae bacterium]|nr:peptidoglycan DD-metalloendopeptidase family protein [Methylophilaceae bacterium]